MNEKTACEGTIVCIRKALWNSPTSDNNDPTFPKTERMLRKHLEQAKTTLMQQGITLIGKRTSEGDTTFLSEQIFLKI